MTSSAGGGVVGAIRVADGRGVVRVEDVYSTDAMSLWGALTEADRLARWIAVVTGDLRMGGIVHARFTSGWEGLLRVDACEPGRRLLVTSGVDEPDETVIEAILTSEGDRTRLVIEERGFSLDVVAAHGAGWHAHVADLGIHLNGGLPEDWRDQWFALIATYEKIAMGID